MGYVPAICCSVPVKNCEGPRILPCKLIRQSVTASWMQSVDMTPRSEKGLYYSWYSKATWISYCVISSKLHLLLPTIPQQQHGGVSVGTMHTSVFASLQENKWTWRIYLTSLTERLFFVPEKDVTYASELLAANTTLRNGPGKKLVRAWNSWHTERECTGIFGACVEDSLSQQEQMTPKLTKIKQQPFFILIILRVRNSLRGV